MSRGGARNGPKQADSRAAADAHTYAMSCKEVAALMGISVAGVWMGERYAIRKLWRMTLPSWGKKEFQIKGRMAL